MSVIEELLGQNRDFAEEFPGEASGIPAREIAVITCMDSRVEPLLMLGLSVGEANILRNAGGVVTEDTLRSLSISQRGMGTQSIMLIQHTDCGLSKTDNEAFLSDLENDTGVRPTWNTGAFKDVEESVRAGMKVIEESPFVDSSDLRGFVYDVKTGLIHEVK